MGGTDGVLNHLLESMLKGELDNRLQESKATNDPNRRNGRTKKNFPRHRYSYALSIRFEQAYAMCQRKIKKLSLLI